jgi:hypothetical protein
VNLTVPVVLIILGGLCLLGALFGGVTGTWSLPTLDKAGRIIAAFLALVLVGAGTGLWVWGVTRDSPKQTPSTISPKQSAPPPVGSITATASANATISSPNLLGVLPSGRLTISNTLKSVKNLDTVRGTSDALCCDETIWILVQPVGYSQVFPQGYCDLRGKDWLCEKAQFGDAGDTPGTSYWVTAIVILNSQEDTYRAVMANGYSHYSPPIKPVLVSETITVTRT